jgi:hypothetical protein
MKRRLLTEVLLSASVLTMAHAATADHVARIEIDSPRARTVNPGGPGNFTGSATSVEQNFGAIAPGVVQYTSDVPGKRGNPL